METKEKLNLMKLCNLCSSVDEKTTEVDADLHYKFGMHRRDGVCWVPTKGHALFENHVKWVKLLGLRKV